MRWPRSGKIIRRRPGASSPARWNSIVRAKAHGSSAGGLADRLRFEAGSCFGTLFDVDLAEVCITSTMNSKGRRAPPGAFRPERRPGGRQYRR